MERSQHTSRGIVGVLTVAILVTSLVVGFVGATPANAAGDILFDEVCSGASELPTAFPDSGYAADCLKLYGLSLGKDDGTFGEGDLLTRSQVASFLTRLLELAGVTLGPPVSFPDVNENTVPNAEVRDEIAGLAGSGIIAGFPDGTFGPAQGMTVAQFATFVLRTLRLIHTEFFSDTPGPPVFDSTLDNYYYAKGSALLLPYPDINGNAYPIEATDVTARGLLANSLAYMVQLLVDSGLTANRAPNQ